MKVEFNLFDTYCFSFWLVKLFLCWSSANIYWMGFVYWLKRVKYLSIFFWSWLQRCLEYARGERLCFWEPYCRTGKSQALLQIGCSFRVCSSTWTEEPINHLLTFSFLNFLQYLIERLSIFCISQILSFSFNIHCCYDFLPIGEVHFIVNLH